MKRSQFSLVVSLIVTGFLIIICSYYVYRYLRRWALISVQRGKIIALKHQADDLSAFGFDEKSELLQLVGGRIQFQQDKMSTDKQGALLRLDGATLSVIISLNKTMLESYLRDLQDFRKFGAACNHPIIIHAHDKIIRLTLALAELDRQYKEHEFDALQDYEKRLARMSDIINESINQYFAELKIVQSDDGKSAFIKEQLTCKMRLLSKIERMLG